MQKTLFIIPLLALTVFNITTPAAYALSCVPTDMYIESTIGDDDTVIFVAKTDKTIEGTDYTAEALTVSSAYQGYVEGKIMVYHTKNETWGYLCNAGPKGNNTEGVYIANLDDAGKYHVSQRLALDDKLVEKIKEGIKDKKVVGEVVEFNKTDRINQITTTIKDLFGQILMLLKEQMYWQGVK